MARPVVAGHRPGGGTGQRRVRAAGLETQQVRGTGPEISRIRFSGN